MDQVLNEINRLVLDLPLIKTIQGCFVVMIAMQSAAALRCLQLIANSNAHRDIKAFMNDYWQWSHLRKNSLILSLWLTSLVAYLSVWLVTLDLKDIALGKAFLKAPAPTLYVLIILILLLAYTVIRCCDQINATKQTIAHLKKMRFYQSFRRVLKSMQGAPISATSWGSWIGTAATATEWVSEHFVKRRIDAEMKEALLRFGTYAALEYLFRMSIVAVAIWVIYR